MAILGNIIKGALEITDKVIPEGSPVEQQQDQLKQLLQKASSTEFGRYYHFDDILKNKDLHKAFTEQVPYHDYDAINEHWWKKQREDGLPDVTWPGKTTYYALSAGTTGDESKRLPITGEMLESIRKTSRNQILSSSNFDFPAEFYQREIIMLGSATKLDKVGNHYEGEISGIAAGNIPNWFERFYRPGKKIASITDWDKRVEAIAKEAKNWDIGAMAGMPSWNELMLKRIIDYNRASKIHDRWPNLRVFVSGGVALDPYRKSFNKLMGKPITFMDTYLASEGFLAYQSRPNPDLAMTLATNAGIYFEFVPFSDDILDDHGSVVQGTKSLSLAEVENHQDYVLIISSVAGAWRYMIGDTIRFTDKDKTEIIITGRTKHFLNVVGSQLSVIQMNKAMQQMEEDFDMQIPEFSVAAVREEDDYIHHWYIGAKLKQDQPKEETIAQALDQSLRNMNKAYNMARNKALKKVKVTIIQPDIFHEWVEKYQAKGGQVKIPRVMKEEEFIEFQKFATKG